MADAARMAAPRPKRRQVEIGDRLTACERIFSDAKIRNGAAAPPTHDSMHTPRSHSASIFDAVPSRIPSQSNAVGLSARFLATGGRAHESGPALEAALVAFVEAARSAWPTLPLATDDFVDHVARHAGDAGAIPPSKHAGDLFLACACAHGVAGAAAAFDAAHAAVLLRVAARFDPSHADDVAQSVREHLLVRTGARVPKIDEYGGRAKLSGWLSTVCTRFALNARRRDDDHAHDSLSTLAAASPEPAPEIAVLRARHAADFHAAIVVALARLTPRDRALLRMTLVGGLTFERVAESYQVSRATAARWLAAARDALRDETLRELGTRLRLTPSELESLTAMVRSDLELSLSTLLRETHA
jgi:RNA polymerase sigma-70 factor (ECF subfamily)